MTCFALVTSTVNTALTTSQGLCYTYTRMPLIGAYYL